MQAKSLPQNLRPPSRRRPSFVLKTLPAAIALLFAPPGWTVDITGAAGLPQNGMFAGGTVSGSVSGNQMTINQSTDRAVLNWGSFNIAAGKSVQIAQPNAASAILNRVTGDANASQILGSLSANGMVMLMNPNGVMFGQGAVVNVGSLIATTGNIDADNFMSTGVAQITGATGSVINEGSITAQGAGLVGLVAPSVINRGSIIATGGTIALGGVTAGTVSLNGGLYEFAIAGGATGTNVTNAAGATLEGATLRLGVGDAANLLSGVINLEGVQQASNAIVVNGNAVVLKSALQAPSVSGNSNHIDVYGGARIQDAVNIAKTGTPGAGASVDVHAGSYAEQVTLNKANMTLTGQSGAKLVVPDTSGQLNGIGITANNVTVTGMEIAGPASQPYTSYAWGNGITRGIAVADGVTGFTISNNNIHDVRNGVLIHGRNSTGSVTGNRIENTKSAISVQYTDGSGITIAGNSQGPVGNEWGLNLHLNGYLSGANIVNNPIAASPTLVWQQALLALSAANGGWSVQDQGYTSSNRTHVNVSNLNSLPTNQGSPLAPLNSVQAGVDAVVTGGIVNVAAGNYTGNVTITKALTLDGAGMGQTILKGASSTSGDAIAIKASGVTVSDLSINDSYYGIHLKDTSNNMTIDRVAFNNNKYSVRSAGDTKADNFRMLNSTISGGVIGFQTYNNYGAGTGNASFKNALFENVTVDGPSYKGFYFETADDLTLRNVTITNAGHVGDDSHLNGAAIDVNLKYGAYGSINFDNVVVKNSGNANSTAVVIKTRGIAGDSSDYRRSPASLQSVTITGGSIEDSVSAGIRFETLSNGSGGQPTVTINGTRFKNNHNNNDITVDGTSVDARGAVFVGAADGFAIEDRVTHALDTTGRGLVTWTDGNVYVTQNSGSIQRGVDAVALGGTVNLAGGTYVQPTTLKINRGVTLAGSGQGATVIDARGVNSYGINVTADNATLRDFTLYGPSANVASAYGIKVAPDGAASARLRNFTIRNVTSRGAGRAELDLNGVDGAVIDSVTANGALVGNDASSTQGAGIQLTDSANVTITNSTTRNNDWGGLALYQANRSYNQQMNNITVDRSNSFTERNPVYLQDESASRDFGVLSIAGFGFAVRNASTAGGNNQYTWLQASQQNAYDYAVNLGSSASSYVQEWNGARATQEFHVGIGNLLGGGTQALSINTALGNAGSGANIRVGAGPFAEDVVVNNPYNLYFSGSTLRSLALNAGASGSGIGGTVTATGTVAQDGVSGFLFNAGVPKNGETVAPVRLLGDTTLVTLGSDITINGDIQNDGGTARALSLFAGSGARRGNVHMLMGGSEANALGQFTVLSNGFNLDSTLWVKGYGINALGSVALADHTLRGQDAGATNTLNAGGNVTGSTISLGAVQVISGGDIVANISGTDVVLNAEGDVNSTIEASRSASATGDTVIVKVIAPTLTVQAATEAQISGSSGQISIDAPKGTVSGNFGQVTNTGSGLVAVNGKPQGNQQLSSNSENNRVIPNGNNLAEGSSADEPALQLAQAGMLTLEGEPVVGRSSPSNAGEAIDNGEAVELDMSPKNEREKE
ncbi:beta strand repeat-containing protein [Polaromonas sp. YR568]|uniref:beta strand repeat-containing protein n=1 Tax=Polaromonas sp. YR568 TaxID=1855301 RepID=UPI00398C1E53